MIQIECANRAGKDEKTPHEKNTNNRKIVILFLNCKEKADDLNNLGKIILLLMRTTPKKLLKLVERFFREAKVLHERSMIVKVVHDR